MPASQLCKELLFYLLLNQKTKNARALIDAFVRTTGELLSATSSGSSFDIDLAEGAVSSPELRKALALARQHFADDLSVTELARGSGLSVRNLSRLFQVELWYSPKQLLMYLRVERAKEHLASGTFDGELELPLSNGDRIHLRELTGPGVSSTQTIALIGSVNALVVGDIVRHKAHAWLEGGIVAGQPGPTIPSWIDGLEEIQARYGKLNPTVHGGRGEPELLAVVIPQQIAYLKKADEIVASYV